MSARLPVLTTSATRTFRACPRLYWFTYEQGYRPIYVDPNRRFGTLGHFGLEAWWTTRMQRPTEPESWLAAALQALTDSDTGQGDAFELARAEVLLVGYHARWAEEPMEVLAVEREFTAPLVNPATGAASRTWGFAGKIDAIVRLPDGEVWAVEHKTSSEDFSDGSDYRTRLLLDPQVSNYLAGARTLGFEVKGCLYDVIGKPAQRPKKKVAEVKMTKGSKKEPPRPCANQQLEDETVDEYRERVAAVVAERPDDFFSRFKVVRLEHEAREAAFDIWQAGVQIREARNDVVWPRNPDVCKRYGRSCDFLGVCTGQADVNDPTRFRVATSTHEELSKPS